MSAKFGGAVVVVDSVVVVVGSVVVVVDDDVGATVAGTVGGVEVATATSPTPPSAELQAARTRHNTSSAGRVGAAIGARRRQ